MLTLICGTPGSGKTQYALKTVHTLAKESGRSVYFHQKQPGEKGGIEGLQLDGWHPMKSANDWIEAPDNVIVVLDEIQFAWPVRSAGAKVPEPVSALATHRHRGIDLFVITQDGSLVDQNLRKIVNAYIYLERPHGMQYSKAWTFQHWCDWKNSSERAIAEVERYKFDPEVWKWYKSATEHTHKAKMPRKVLLLFPLLFVVIGAGWYLMHLLKSRAESQAKKTTEATQVKAEPKKSAGPGPAADRKSVREQAIELREKRELANAEWIKDQMPRIPDLPYSSRQYDELAKPVSFPLVSACVVNAKTDTCRCYSQQGTPMVVSESFCRDFVVNGSFDHFMVDKAHGLLNKREGMQFTPETQSRPSIARQADGGIARIAN
jgi:zona occludens toxin